MTRYTQSPTSSALRNEPPSILLHLPQAELVCDIVATIMLQQLVEKIKSDRFLPCARCLN